MFGQQLMQKAGLQAQAMQPQSPTAPQQASPLDELNAKLDKILMLLQQDVTSDQQEGGQQ